MLSTNPFDDIPETPPSQRMKNRQHTRLINKNPFGDSSNGVESESDGVSYSDSETAFKDVCEEEDSFLSFEADTLIEEGEDCSIPVVQDVSSPLFQVDKEKVKKRTAPLSFHFEPVKANPGMFFSTV